MQTGQLIDDRYRIEQRLGSGGMAAVYRAHDQVLDRPVAVKVLAGSYASAPAARELIRVEARSAARLSHPNVTNVYDYGEATDNGARLPYVVMELLPGRTLSDRLADGPLPVQAALRVCAEVAGGLAAAHAQGVVHRDVKPSNVMLTPSGAKVLDFGIAAAAGRAEREADGLLLGTPAYLAPERLQADHVSPASDVYALGLLAYRLLAHRMPWAAETTTQMLRSHAYVEPMQLPAVPGVPEEVHRIVQQCLAKTPADRPPASEVARVFANAAGLPPLADHGIGGLPSSGDTATLPLAAWPVAAQGRDRRRTRVLAAVGVAAVAAGAVLLALTLDDNPPEGAAQQPAGPTADASSAAPTEAPTQSPATQPPSRRPPARPSPSAAAVGLTEVPFATLGGAVRVTCQGSTARVVALDPRPGYEVKDFDAGPAEEVKVVLRSATNESELRVICAGGQPIPTTIKDSPR